MRYVLIDYTHLAHRCQVAEPLSVMIKTPTGVESVDTTIPNYTIKNVYAYGGKGAFHTGVFLEGGSGFRKRYFSVKVDGTADTSEGYKGTRADGHGSFYTGIGNAIKMMAKGKVSLYRVSDYEADDLIYNVIQRIKETDTTTPIDVITNDSDLLPLVDEQVSVYIRGMREFAEDGCPSRRLYYQVTPRSWADYLSYSSSYKGYIIPYNSILLFKLIRGDKADNVPGSCKGYGAKKYSELMRRMIEDNVDFENVFRYGVDFDSVMRPVLVNYFDEESVNTMKYIYGGIGLRMLEGGAKTAVPKQIEKGLLQYALDPYRINLR